ncbi:Telomere length regulation protein TEL2 like protein [Argiope bruennichi]|uniref:Telomere length regulation protein TEL2 like protein n=1 Tax=Argiope bruennichi TaxID=94029 RepID=A0A8T0F4Z0_ARGBR|nr:Telomere length regulation protein TEL2 like protein [Argiope bruennichi]
MKIGEKWDPEFAALSKTWNDLITFIASLPERIANKTKGQMHKIFCANFYVPHLMSSIIEVLTSLHQKIIRNEGCTLEFLGKLIGKFCILGHGDVVAKRLYMELIRRSEITPWYGNLEWVLGEEGANNRKLNYVMSTKLLLIRYFKKAIVLQNIIGYFASASSRQSHFWNIFSALAKSWSDESAAKHQSVEQQKYLASALIVCAGWIKQTENVSNAKACLDKILHGTMIRVGNSEECIRSLAMLVGNFVISSIDPDGPKLECEEIVDENLIAELEALMVIPSNPGKDSLYLEGINFFKEEKPEKVEKELKNTNESSKVVEVDSDDDLEPYDTSNDVPQEQLKRPFYLNDCLQGLIEQEEQEWFEQCLKHAESLIESNSDKVHEIAVEMAKVMLHLEDKYCFPDFLSTRHRILVSLTVHCPVLVAEYLTSQFYEDNYNIRQRLDILEVIASSSQLLSNPKSVLQKAELSVPQTEEKFTASTEKLWKTILDQRVASKTRQITKVKRNVVPESLENRLSAVAGYFFFPLMANYDKTNKMLKLFGEDSYVLGRLVYTLGVVMHASANIPICQNMGQTLLQFLADVRNHADFFVREACIFAMAAVFTSVPGYLLMSDDMTSIVFESQEWLESVIDNDPETSCQIKATHALSLIIQIITADMPLMCDILSTEKEML